MRLGVISDTHGLLRPEVFEVFRQVDHIFHAGDIGSLAILTELDDRHDGPPEPAIAYARGLVALDPYAEDGWARLVSRLRAAGHTREAEEQYAAARTALARAGTAVGARRMDRGQPAGLPTCGPLSARSDPVPEGPCPFAADCP